MILAKDNGSTDNITVVVVFLKPIEDILHKIRTEYHHLEGETTDNYDTVDCGSSFTYIKIPGLYEGITSTSKFVTYDDNMNGDSTENLTNGDDIGHQLIEDTPSPGIKANSNNPFSTMMDPGLSDKQFQGDSSVDFGNNPFSSPGAQAFGGFGEVVNPFADMSGNDAHALHGGFEDGRIHSSSEGGDDSLDGSCNDQMFSQEQGLLNLSGEEFKQADPTMFEESRSPSMFEKPPIEPITPLMNNSSDGALMNDDFVPNPAHSWMTSPKISNASNASSTEENPNQNISVMAPTGIGANPLTNPFLPPNKCGDSGFISPAGNSQHQSASSSSEDSAENREERESVERASSIASDRQSDAASVASVHELIEKRESISSDKPEFNDEGEEDSSDDEEAKEHKEVAKLLSGQGMMDPQLGDFMASVNRGTPTPPVEENGK